MAGIYIHIPFCAKACHYCDFHFSTQLDAKKELIEAILLEIDQKKEYLKGEQIETLYFGGGTPSLLTEEEIETIVKKLENTFGLNGLLEFTFEVNPDDVSAQRIANYKNIAINRLSVGIQTFNDEKLRFMNRNHTVNQSFEVLEQLQKNGFDNFSLDLIYGIPHPDHEILYADLEAIRKINPPHVSAYCLTIEPKTAFGKWKRQGKMVENDNDFNAFQFDLVASKLAGQSLIQYEVSNFGKESKFAIHNTNYWKNINYIGLGPSAHSFNGIQRQFNVANNALYIKKVKAGEGYFELENLTQNDRINEKLMTGLRTIWGVDLEFLTILNENQRREFENTLSYYLKMNILTNINNKIFLQKQHFKIADKVASDLFIVN